MFPILRAWLAFAAIGSGIVHAASAFASAPSEGVILAAFGAAELAWGLATLVLSRLVVPRVARFAALVPVAGWGLLALLAEALGMPRLTATLVFLPMAVTALFDLFIAGGLSVYLRCTAINHAASAATANRTPPGGARYLIGLVAGGLLVSLLTAPALAAIPTAGTPAPGLPSQITPHEHSGH